MRNSPTAVFHESADRGGAGERGWQTDRQPAARLVWLFSIVVACLGCVLGRLCYLQALLADGFVQAAETLTETFEPIPSRDGRILADDGRVLAYDLERFNILMHYRWLEEPANESWLKQQALARLARPERRDPERVAAAQRDVLTLREAMWNRLAQLTLPDALQKLTQERRRIQSRVERIAAHVRERQHRRLNPHDQSSRHAPRAVRPDEPWYQAAWQTVVAALTTPPHRSEAEPLVVQEELDYHLILQNVTLPVAAEIESHPERFPGLRIEVSTERVYPEGSLAAHTVGTRTGLDDDELTARRTQFPKGDPFDYQRGDRIGRTGVERSYERHLRGLRGVKKVVKDRRGEVLRTETLREPRIGGDVVLTLHMPLQTRIERLLDDVLGDGRASPASAESAQETGSVEVEPIDGPITDSVPTGAAIVALDIHTGELVALANAPRFNLQLLHQPDHESWQRVVGDPRQPFFPRASQMTLPPGSVFKTLTAIAALESKQFHPDETVFCQGYLDHPNKDRCYIYRHFGVGHGDMDLTDALCQSCNVYFFTAARKMGPQPMVEWAERLGFGRPTGIDLPGERGGNLPRPDLGSGQRTKFRRNPQTVGPLDGSNSEERAAARTPWYPGDTLGLAIGQSRLTATPLQIARMMAAVANGGYLVTPHVVRDGGPMLAGDSLASFAPREPQRIAGLSPETLPLLREGLQKVVAHPRGTGYKRVRLTQIEIAGKTGTAEVGGGKPDHAWFAGYVPADRPRYAFAVVLEHGGSGGAAAGPVTRQLVEALLEHGLLEPAAVAARP